MISIVIVEKVDDYYFEMLNKACQHLKSSQVLFSIQFCLTTVKDQHQTKMNCKRNRIIYLL